MTSSVSVTVPATTANIGPGFDCLGAALTLYNHFEFRVAGVGAPAVTIEAEGLAAEKVSTAADNLVYQSFLHLYRHLDQTPPPIKVKIRLNVPLARGLGSSATAIIGGLVGANAIAQNPLSTKEVLDLAINLEGHPDNVAPALLGNCQLSTQRDSGSTLCCPISWAADLVPLVAIPDFELATHKARTVLPRECSYADSIFNASHLALLVKGLESGRKDWLSAALHDRLHQPYRTKLIKGYESVTEAAIAAGAYGLVISGAGPTLLAICPATHTDAVSSAIDQTWRMDGVEAIVQPLQLDRYGAQVKPIES